MKILITGFDPFGGETVNPAYEAIRLLPDEIAGAEIIKKEIPTVFSRSAVEVEKAIEEYQPDVVVNVGQAGGRSTVTPEKVAVNIAEARIPDNDGEQPSGEPLREDGEPAYFSLLPIGAMIENVRAHGIPCFPSYSAGTYVCNAVMYNVLYLVDKKYPNLRAGFIHVPYASEQVVNKPNGTAFMSLHDIAKCLEYCVEAIVENADDNGGAPGAIC